MKERVLFLAGSFDQAEYWANQLGFTRSEWQYLPINAIRGMREPTIFMVGTWWQRPDWDELWMSLIPCEPTLIYAEEMVP